MLLPCTTRIAKLLSRAHRLLGSHVSTVRWQEIRLTIYVGITLAEGARPAQVRS